jgi:hypothetical protein
MSGQFHAPADLLRRKDAPVPICVPQGLSGPCGEEKNILPLSGVDPESSVVQPVS